MDRGQRVKVISESAELLAKREWSEIDLILEQFGMSTDNSWIGRDKRAYAIEMQKGHDDDALKDLHQFLTGHSELEGVPSGPHPWKDEGLRLFMSHLAKHQNEVGEVATWLDVHGIDAFVAHTSIEPSLEWQDVIESALRSCQAMAVFLHDGFHQSNWCDQEVGFAMARQIPVLPLRYDLNPYGFMAKLQAENCTKIGPIPVAHKIIDWLLRTPSLRDGAVDGLVSAFEHSGSYDQTRRLLPYLEGVSKFTSEQLKRLDKATKENSQVVDALYSGTTVPKRIASLIAEHRPRQALRPRRSLRPRDSSGR